MLDTRCPVCKTPVIDWTASVCPECFGGNSGIGVPNQRELLNGEENQALQARYQQAKQNTNSAQLEQLETAIQTDSKAVINEDAEALAGFLLNEKKLYASYSQQVALYGGVSHQTIAKIVAPQTSQDFARISERATTLGIECLAA